MRLLKKIASYIWDIPIEKSGSELNPYLEVVWSQGRKMLNAQNANYSFGNGYKVFERAFDELKVLDNPPQSVLVLGFGCGSVEHLLQTVLGIKSVITGVEYDAEIIRLYQAHFAPESPAKVHCMDAREFLSNNQEQYDLIVVDLFQDLETVPMIYEGLFTDLILKASAPGGQLVYNTVKNAEHHDLFSELLLKLSTSFKEVGQIDFQEINRILIAK